MTARVGTPFDQLTDRQPTVGHRLVALRTPVENFINLRFYTNPRSVHSPEHIAGAKALITYRVHGVGYANPYPHGSRRWGEFQKGVGHGAAIINNIVKNRS